MNMTAHVMHMPLIWHRHIADCTDWSWKLLDGRDHAATAGFSKVATLQQAFLAHNLTNPYKQRFGASHQNGCYKCRIRTHYHQQVGLTSLWSPTRWKPKCQNSTDRWSMRVVRPPVPQAFRIQMLSAWTRQRQGRPSLQHLLGSCPDTRNRSKQKAGKTMKNVIIRDNMW